MQLGWYRHPCGLAAHSNTRVGPMTCNDGMQSTVCIQYPSLSPSEMLPSSSLGYPCCRGCNHTGHCPALGRIPGRHPHSCCQAPASVTPAAGGAITLATAQHLVESKTGTPTAAAKLLKPFTTICHKMSPLVTSGHMTVYRAGTRTLCLLRWALPRPGQGGRAISMKLGKAHLQMMPCTARVLISMQNG